MFPERMLALMKEKKISRKTISEEVGFGINQIKYWETHGNVPSGEVLARIAQYLDVSVDYLLEKTDVRNYELEKNDGNNKLHHLFISYKSEPSDTGKMIAERILTDIEQKMIEIFRTTSEEGQLRMIQSFMDIREDARSTQEEKSILIHHSLLKVSAGTGTVLDDENTEEWRILKNYYTKNADFCVTVTGDSMEPTYKDGDIVLVRATPEICKGEVGVFLLNGEGFIKELGDGFLLSHSAAYENIPVTAEDQFVCFGKVLGILKQDWIVSR